MGELVSAAIKEECEILLVITRTKYSHPSHDTRSLSSLKLHMATCPRTPVIHFSYFIACSKG